MKQFRKFLKKNEVFFTTICAVILSFMGIIVSIKSYQLTEMQYQIDYFDKSPDFQIEEHQMYNDEKDYFDHTDLTISKISGKAKNINIKVINFVDFELTDFNNVVKRSRFTLHHYYDTSFKTGKNEGVIQTSTGYLNNKRFIDFEMAIENLLKKDYQFAFSDLKTYVSISYLNFENKYKTDYYDVDIYSGNLLTDSISAKKIFVQYREKMLEEHLTLNDITKMDLNEIKKKIQKYSK